MAGLWAFVKQQQELAARNYEVRQILMMQHTSLKILDKARMGGNLEANELYTVWGTWCISSGIAHLSQLCMVEILLTDTTSWLSTTRSVGSSRMQQWTVLSGTVEGETDHECTREGKVQTWATGSWLQGGVRRVCNSGHAYHHARMTHTNREAVQIQFSPCPWKTHGWPCGPIGLSAENKCAPFRTVHVDATLFPGPSGWCSFCWPALQAGMLGWNVGFARWWTADRQQQLGIIACSRLDPDVCPLSRACRAQVLSNAFATWLPDLWVWAKLLVPSSYTAC